MNLLYLIGEPGVGKTTLLEMLTYGQPRRQRKLPFLCTEYQNGLLQLGYDRQNGFGGTDALSMSVQPDVVELLRTKRWPRIVGEGDRLANRKFFQQAKDAGYKVDVVLLEAPPDVCAIRREMRGSNQNLAWLKGRQTKVKNLSDCATIRLDTTRPTAELVAELSRHPVFQEN